MSAPSAALTTARERVEWFEGEIGGRYHGRGASRRIEAAQLESAMGGTSPIGEFMARYALAKQTLAALESRA
jgi:hypothetical protein